MIANNHRFKATHPCPICGGHDLLPRKRGRRRFGYLDDTGEYARCTREDMAGAVPQNPDGTYSHWFRGECRCGLDHTEVSICRSHFKHGGAKPDKPPVLRGFRSYAALASFLRSHHGPGATITPWHYHNPQGKEIFRLLRIDFKDEAGKAGKSYRPCYEGDDGRWQLSKPNGLLPLYRLPALLAAPRDATVYVLEGEKCAEIALDIGLNPVTTSAHGAQAPRLSDWSPLAGRRVIIVRDEGNTGGSYAWKVESILNRLQPPANVTVVRLPGLSEGEDIEQWVKARQAEGLRNDEICSALLTLIDASTRKPDSLLDDLFHGCALAAYLDQAVAEGGWPGSDATRMRAYRYYEEALAEKNRGR